MALGPDREGELVNPCAAEPPPWRRALDLQPDPDPEALRLFDGDNNAPRSALDAAMLRWQEPAQLPQALDAVSTPALAAALAGPAGAQREAWGFKQRNQLLVFETLGHQRCLLQGVRAATAHQLGRGPASPPLASADCEGIGSAVQELLCARLQQASASNPRATVTGRWLACPTPSPAGSAAAAGSPG
jgi:hypothetical protein